jgi:hypothetical protein
VREKPIRTFLANLSRQLVAASAVSSCWNRTPLLLIARPRFDWSIWDVCSNAQWSWNQLNVQYSI